MMNSNNPFGGPQASSTNTQNQNPLVFGQTSIFAQTTSAQSAPFGQTLTSHSTPIFGQQSNSQSSSVFGQTATAQSIPAFGQSGGNAASTFGQATPGQSSNIFGQANAGQPSVFGQASAGQSSVFGQAAGQSLIFGQTSTSGQSALAFGQSSAGQPAPAFGQSTGGQSALAFGQASGGQSALTFGQASGGQSALAFGQASGGQSAPAFGQSTGGQSAPAFGQSPAGPSGFSFGQSTAGQSGISFGQSTSGQSRISFGQSTAGQSGLTFGQSTTGQSALGFGQSTAGRSAPAFGLSTAGQSTLAFGQSTPGPSAPAFGQSTPGPSAPAFGQSTPGPSAPAFGQSMVEHSTPGFGQSSAGQSVPAFGQSVPAFGQSSAGQSVPAFGQSSAGQSSPAFGQASAFGQATGGQPAFMFGQITTSQPTPAFRQSTNNQSTCFGQETLGQTSVLGQGTTGQSPFGQPAVSQSVATFGHSTVQSGPILGNTNQSSFAQESSSQSVTPFSKATSSQPISAFAQSTISQSIGTQSTTSQSASPFGTNVTGFGQTTSGQVPLFGKGITGQSLAQTSSSQSGQIATNQFSGFAQGMQGNLGQSRFSPSSSRAGHPVFVQPTSGLKSSFTSTGQTVSSEKANILTTDKTSAFGAPSSASGQPVGTTTQMSASSNVPDAKLPTSSAALPFVQFSSLASSNTENIFQPPANTTFKPIFSGTDTSTNEFAKSAPTNKDAQPLIGNTTGSASGEMQSSSLFSFYPGKKNKEETGSFRPLFASAESSFISFTEDPKREDKSMKRKEEQGRSPNRNEPAPFDDATSELRSDHPPVKRASRLNRDLKGGANLLVRSLYDVVKSQMKTQHGKDAKRDNETLGHLQEPDPDNSTQIQAAGTNYTSSGSSPAGSVKPHLAFSQSTFTKTQPAAPASRMLPLTGLIQQPTGRDHSTSAPGQLGSTKNRALLEEEELSAGTEATSSKTPLRRPQRTTSTEHTGPLSPIDQTIIHVKNLPRNMNQKIYLENFFKRFGKIQHVYCRPASNLAIIHFNNHNAAAAARKAAKKLHPHVVAFWQRKKLSPNKKETLLSTEENVNEKTEEKQMEQKSSSMTSPICRPPARALKTSPLKKSHLSKSLQFDVESTDSPVPSSDNTGTSLPPSLLHLVGMVAENSEEKYRLLDQRDKILRQARVKRTELDQAKLYVGTCPDMCPEKERYMRDTRNQLSIYEFLPGTDKLDHAAAIKEYSRSSADQEEPLPHELRPIPVLCMTMDYLVTHIMDVGESNYRDWYDFVWNRTRGIRKDITQQHLCDPFTVSLMEKCTRFHIHCAYELCEESMSSFDPKINNENLTKCMQSLKEMYQDLHHRGEDCPSEPEFRGYSVLLNLNKGDILREVQQFHETVRNSAEVKFAVQVFAALNSTNFVRFFRLVRSASYLNSCILHCYFGQIRRDALRALNVAYTASTLRPTLFPLENMVRLLCFQDAQEATDFLTAYGLCVSEGFVEFNRTAFTEPEAPLQRKRFSFISQKKYVSVGEVVYGVPLPQLSMHVPVCSFDAQDKYIGISSLDQGVRASQDPTDKQEAQEQVPEERIIKRSVVLLSDTQEPSSVPTQSVFQPIQLPETLPPPPPPKPLFSDEDVSAVLDDIVEESVREFCTDLSQRGCTYTVTALGESSLVAENLLSDVVVDFSHTVAVDELRLEAERVKEENRRKLEEARQIQQREQLLSMVSQSQCVAMINEIVTESIHQISSDELQKAVKIDYNKRVKCCSLYVCDKLVERWLAGEILQLSRGTLREMKCCSKYMQRWREVLAARKKLRRQMRGFPAAPGSVGYGGSLKALIPSAKPDINDVTRGFIDLGHAGKLGVPFTRCQQLRKQIFHQMKVQHYFQELLCDVAWTPLELPSLIAQKLTPWKQAIFWKVVLALPEITEPSDSISALSTWLKAKFCWGGIQPADDQQPIQTLAQYSSFEDHEGQPVRVNVCVKVLHGPLSDTGLDNAEIHEEVLGSSAILLLLPPRLAITDVYWLCAELQLKQLLQATPIQPPLAVAVLSFGSSADSDRQVEQEFGLPELASSGLISEYIIVNIPDDVNNMKGTNMVSSAVEFLLSRSPHPFELHSLPFQQYIEDGVCREFHNPFYHDVSERRKSRLPSQDPAAIIDLYNDAIVFLAEAVTTERLSELSWPVTEFTCPGGSSLMPPTGWNSPGHLAWLRKAVLSFQLPQMDKPPQGAPWGPVCSMVTDYVSQIVRSPTSLPLLLSEVQLLLKGVLKCCLEEGRSHSDPSVGDIPWDDLIARCINHKLQDWETPFITDDQGSQKELLVYFFKEDLIHFTYPETWDRACLKTHKDVLENHQSPARRSKNPKTPLRTVPVTQLGNTEDDFENPEVTYLKSLPSQLNQALLAEKIESEKFTKKLQQLLQEDLLDTSLCLPMYLPSTSLTEPLERLIRVPSPRKSSSFGALCSPTKRESLTERSVRSPWLSMSLKESMNYLTLNIKQNQQEDKAFNLHLSTLLDVARH